MPDLSPAKAQAVSEELVRQACLHVSSRLANTDWLAQNREVANNQEYVCWRVAGCNHLDANEMAQVRSALLAAGWRTVVTQPRFHDARTNWEVRVTLAGAVSSAARAREQ